MSPFFRGFLEELRKIAAVAEPPMTLPPAPEFAKTEYGKQMKKVYQAPTGAERVFQPPRPG